MGKKKDESKKHIISCRVNDNEMRILQKRAHQDGVSITELLRSVLNFAETQACR